MAEDRERIARDLHDQVIQRLFAAGMSLQAVQPRIGDTRAAERVGQIVEGLDEAIREIRTAIFRLGPAPRSRSVRAQVLDVAEEVSRPLGFSPKVVFEGPVDTAIPASMSAHVVAVVREALTNAARHAHATQVAVEVGVDRQICVVVSDNGVGLGPTGRRSGLANLAEPRRGAGRRAHRVSPPRVVAPESTGGCRSTGSAALATPPTIGSPQRSAGARCLTGRRGRELTHLLERALGADPKPGRASPACASIAMP